MASALVLAVLKVAYLTNYRDWFEHPDERVAIAYEDAMNLITTSIMTQLVSRLQLDVVALS